MQKTINLELDRNQKKSTWSSYLKKYSSQYKLFCDEIGIWSIKLNKKLGFIQPFSITNKQLVAVLSFRSKQHKTCFKNNLVRMAGFDLKITQEGDTELSIVFDEKYIIKLESLLSIKKRRSLTTEQRKTLVKRMKKIRRD